MLFPRMRLNSSVCYAFSTAHPLYVTVLKKHPLLYCSNDMNMITIVTFITNSSINISLQLQRNNNHMLQYIAHIMLMYGCG